VLEVVGHALAGLPCARSAPAWPRSSSSAGTRTSTIRTTGTVPYLVTTYAARQKRPSGDQGYLCSFINEGVLLADPEERNAVYRQLNQAGTTTRFGINPGDRQPAMASFSATPGQVYNGGLQQPLLLPDVEGIEA